MATHLRALTVRDIGDHRVLHGMRLIQHAAGCVLGSTEAFSFRDQLLSGYWNLLQSTRWMSSWPSELRDEFLEIQAAFFQDGLPPETVLKMTASEAEAASEMIIRFYEKARAIAFGETTADLMEGGGNFAINDASRPSAPVEACALG